MDVFFSLDTIKICIELFLRGTNMYCKRRYNSMRTGKGNKPRFTTTPVNM